MLLNPTEFVAESESGDPSLMNLMTAVLANAPPSRPDEGVFLPPVPETIGEAGITAGLVEQLILKQLYFKDEIIGRDLSEGLGLKFSLIEGVVDELKRRHMVAVRGSLGWGSISSVFSLSEAGRTRAREVLDRNQYNGPAPIPLEQYVQAVRTQRLRSGWLTQEALHDAYKHMVMSPDILAKIGPAANSGKSFLIYGHPGNGKTYMAEALFKVESSNIFVPYALECEGTIVRVFDPVYHKVVDNRSEATSSLAAESAHDGRWALCRRPFIVTGGELTLAMLDLSYNRVSKVYDAPFQVKANNGIYLIDDFGRQQVSPAEVLNRWIVPMDRRVDYLTFVTGGKVEVPFEAFLIFSTNMRPAQFGDEAFLRRLDYKMLLRSPEVKEFSEIFARVCAKSKISVTPGCIERFISKHYTLAGKAFRRCQPGDTLSHALDLIHFEQLPFELTDDVLDRAFESCFIHAEGVDD